MVQSDCISNDLEMQRTFLNKDSIGCILTVFETIWNYRDDFENKDAKWCNLTVFKTIWSCRENNENKDDKWRILTVYYI